MNDQQGRGVEPEEQISAVNRPQEDESDGEFEFSVSAGSATDPAGDIFSNGRILPVYPVFDRSLLDSDSDPDPSAQMRSLLLTDRVQLRSGSASSSSSAESLDVDAPPAVGAYCSWTPRSASAGSGSRPGSETPKWRIVRDWVGGRRSHSDGKEKLAFFSSESGLKEKARSKSGLKEGVGAGAGAGAGSGSNLNAKKNKKVKEMDLVTAHKLFYGKEREGGEKGGKRSFLPYNVGLFANSRGNHFPPK